MQTALRDASQTEPRRDRGQLDTLDSPFHKVTTCFLR